MKEAELTDSSNNIEQSQETIQPPHQLKRSDLAEAHRIEAELIRELEKLPDGDMVAEIVVNGLKLLRDQINRGDIKLVNKSFKELSYALKVFAPYHSVRKVSIFGSAHTPEDHPDYKQAEEFAKRMAALGWMVTTGAGGGIMAAGHGGAGAQPSFGLAIRLPFEQKTNPFIEKDEKLINFKYFFTRKLMFLRSSHAVVIFPGGFGTMDEGFEVLTLVQTGKSVPMPIVFVDSPGGEFWQAWQDYIAKQLLSRGFISKEDLRLYKVTDNVETAIHEIRHFYSNYHSMRYSRDDAIIRLHRRPNEKQLAEINERFKDIVVRGEYRVSDPLPIERDEPALADLSRLVFAFNKRNHGRLRALIDHLNDLST